MSCPRYSVGFVARSAVDRWPTIAGTSRRSTDQVLRRAAAAGWRDFEDAVTAAAATRARCDAIVTRNPRDFAKADARVVTPSDAAAALHRR
jgi:hypothetical protein